MNRFFTLLLAASCLTAVGQYQVGDVGPAGGWIFYVDSLNEFDWDYLEVASSYCPVACNFWGGTAYQDPNGPTVDFNDFQAIGMGEFATAYVFEKWIHQSEGQTAAGGTSTGHRVAMHEVLGFHQNGYADWFLPSIEELLEVFTVLPVEVTESFGPDIPYASGGEYVYSSSPMPEPFEGYVRMLDLEDLSMPFFLGNRYPPSDAGFLVLPIRAFGKSAEGSCGQGTIWDEASQTCIPDNPSDLNYDGCVDVNDFMGHLAAFGSGCEEGVVETPWICGCPIEFHGYAYETVLIDGQCWFAENLKSEKYRNDDPIPTELTDGQWGSSVNGASAIYGEGVYGYGGSICYDYSPVGNSCDETWALSEFGRLYNWYAVNDLRGLCPYDWHVPSSLEWDLLLLNQGGGDIAMNKLKSINGWAGGGNGNNESGFKALPGGYRTGNGQFFGGAGETGVWWTSTQAGNEARNVRLTSQNDSFTETYSPNRGFSIRCIKD